MSNRNQDFCSCGPGCTCSPCVCGQGAEESTRQAASGRDDQPAGCGTGCGCGR